VSVLGIGFDRVSAAGLTIDIVGGTLLSWDLSPDFVATRTRREWNTQSTTVFSPAQRTLADLPRRTHLTQRVAG
jgi:hypothetical protein